MRSFCLVFVLGLMLALPAHAQEATPPPVEEVEEIEDLEIPDADQASAATAEPEPERDPQAMNPAPADPSLLPVFKAFGEEAGLVALMDDFMVRLLADPRTRPFFENSSQAMVKKHLVEQFCVILGGPCSYTGRDMRTAHKGFDIDRAQFNALVEILQVSMNARGIPFRAQNKLLAKLAPMHRDIEHR